MTPSKYLKLVHSIVFIANKLNNNKIKYPVWGTCLGYEALLLALSDYSTPIENTLDNLNILLPAMIDMTKKSVLNEVFSSDELNIMSASNVFHYGHRWGFLIEKMQNDEYVQKSIDIVATTVTTHNQKVVAAFQHKVYPYFGVQFHPEFGQFTHEDGSQIDKTEVGVEINRKFAMAMLTLLKDTHTRMTNIAVQNYKKELLMTLTMFKQNEAYYHIPISAESGVDKMVV